jgi:hypothetical protein
MGFSPMIVESIGDLIKPLLIEIKRLRKELNDEIAERESLSIRLDNIVESISMFHHKKEE